MGWKPNCNNTQGLIACFVCMLIWNFQGFILQAVFKQWQCTLFASYTSAWFLSTHLIIAISKTYFHQSDPKTYTANIVFNRKIVLSCVAAGVALIVSNISSNFAFSDIKTPVLFVFSS